MRCVLVWCACLAQLTERKERNGYYRRERSSDEDEDRYAVGVKGCKAGRQCGMRILRSWQADVDGFYRALM